MVGTNHTGRLCLKPIGQRCRSEFRQRSSRFAKGSENCPRTPAHGRGKPGHGGCREESEHSEGKMQLCGYDFESEEATRIPAIKYRNLTPTKATKSAARHAPDWNGIHWGPGE